VLMAAPVHADDLTKTQAVTDPKLRASIQRAIERGVDYLKRSQRRTGEWHWASLAAYTPGVTALSLYALAASGVSAEDAALARGVKWTSKHDAAYRAGRQYATYSASALVLALARMDPERHAVRVRGIAQWLVNGQTAHGSWSYALVGHGGRGDNSNSQFAIMALWMAETHCGFRAPEKTWKRVRRMYTRTQVKDGGWNYGHGRGASSDSMTAAGLFGYVVSGASLAKGTASLPKMRKEKRARRGLARLLRANAQGNFYFLYGLERAATIMDAPPRDWYVENARALVKSQRASGSWGSRDPYSTSLALLFLSRATRYVLTPRRVATTARTAKFPRVVTVENLKRAFEAYLLSTPAERKKVRYVFAGAGTESLALFVDRLADPEEPVRSAAYELLIALLRRPILFDPTAAASDRKIMLIPIRSYFEKNRVRLRWEKQSSRFVVR